MIVYGLEDTKLPHGIVGPFLELWWEVPYSCKGNSCKALMGTLRSLNESSYAP